MRTNVEAVLLQYFQCFLSMVCQHYGVAHFWQQDGQLLIYWIVLSQQDAQIQKWRHSRRTAAAVDKASLSSDLNFAR